MRVSYNDYKLYLSILDSVSKQLNKAIKSEASSKVTDEIPDHDFDGKTNISHVVHSVDVKYWRGPWSFQFQEIHATGCCDESFCNKTYKTLALVSLYIF